MSSRSYTRRQYIGISTAFTVTTIAASVAVASFGFPAISYASDSSDSATTASDAAKRAAAISMTNQQKADGLRKAADAAAQAGDLESADTLKDWAAKVEASSTPADFTTLSPSSTSSAEVGTEAQLAQPNGFFVFVTGATLRTAAGLIRTSPGVFVAFAETAKERTGVSVLDENSEIEILNSANEIADRIDFVADEIDRAMFLSYDATQEKLTNELRGVVGDGNAKVIAEAVLYLLKNII